VDYGQGFDPGSRLFVPETGSSATMKTRPEKLASFRDQEFAAKKAPGTLRIAALGGSSVNYLDGDFRVLEAHLLKALAPRYHKVEVINAGGLSYGSHRLARIAAETIEYDPDIVFFYEAHNEFEEVEQLQLASLQLVKPQKVLSRSALVRVIRDRVTAIRVARLRTEHEERVRKTQRDLDRSIPNSARAWYHQFSPQDVAARMDAYRKNLMRIAELCRSKRIAFLLATVPSNLAKPYLNKDDAVRYLKVEELIKRQEFDEARSLGYQILEESTSRHQSSNLENAIIRSLATGRGVFLVDVESAVIQAEPHHLPGETLFKDHCHLNAEGNAILRSTLESEILKLVSLREGTDDARTQAGANSPQ
jgi:hypothetical protein